MATTINRLNARFVQTVSGNGYYCDGAGLYLAVRGDSKSWVFRYRQAGKLRDLGLGSALIVSLAEARELAKRSRSMVAQRVDPIAEKRAAAAAERAAHASTRWGEACAEFIELQKPGWKNEAQAGQWEQSLKEYGPAAGLLPREVTTEIVLACLSPIWTSKAETAARVRARIERVWDYCRTKGLCTGENPARWKGHLSAILPKPSKVKKVKHFEAMDYHFIPEFMRELRARKAMTARALELCILTATRSSEVIGLQWSEIRGNVWTIPANRTKPNKEYVIPLTASAVRLLEKVRKEHPGRDPFKSSENGMLNLVQKRMGFNVTVHGFRATFSTWASECTTHSGEVREMCLGHQIKDKAEAAYRRGDMIAKRRALLEEWERHLNG